MCWLKGGCSSCVSYGAMDLTLVAFYDYNGLFGCKKKRKDIRRNRMTVTHKRQTMHSQSNAKTLPKRLIIHRLRTDLSDNSHPTGVVNPSVRVKPSHFLLWLWYQKDNHLKFIDKPQYRDQRPTIIPIGEVIKIDHTNVVGYKYYIHVYKKKYQVKFVRAGCDPLNL